jgi:hypothetical protein
LLDIKVGKLDINVDDVDVDEGWCVLRGMFFLGTGDPKSLPWWTET